MVMLMSTLTVLFSSRLREEVLMRFNVEKLRFGQAVDLGMVSAILKKVQRLGKQEYAGLESFAHRAQHCTSVVSLPAGASEQASPRPPT